MEKRRRQRPKLPYPSLARGLTPAQRRKEVEQRMQQRGLKQRGLLMNNEALHYTKGSPMPPSLSRKSAALVLLVLAVALGCNSRTTGPATPSARNAGERTHQASTSAPGLPKWAAADEAKGYLHKQSGVGFIYPAGWDNLGAKTQGPITQLGLRKDAGAIEVTLYWTALDRNQAPENIGANELAALRQLYRDKVSGPESVTTAGQAWQKLSITGGPPGATGPNLTGVVYVFALRRNQQPWKIKLRATVRSPEKMTVVEGLLNNYRQE